MQHRSVYRDPSRRYKKLAGAGLLALLLGLFSMPVQAGPAPIQTFFVPLPELEVQASLRSVDTNNAIGNTMRSIIPILATGNNTIIYYDHWEDGYEADMANPVQGSTEIWGDNDPANGMPPGFAADLIDTGDVITLENNVALPRDPSQIRYDGRDKFGGTRAVAVTRAAWALNPGVTLAGAVEVYPLRDYGTQFEVPVGEDLSSNQMFQYVSLLVLASADGTLVQIDTDGNGTVDISRTLNQGETYQVDGGIQTGAAVTASQPIQAHIITGDIGARYESRFYTLYPVEGWSDSYYSPVGTAADGDRTDVFVYNPNAAAITVDYATMAGSGSFNVAAGTTYRYPMPAQSGAHFSTGTGSPFFAIATVGANPGANLVHDWGFSLLPESYLTTMTVVGWGPGSDDLSVNGSPVWLTPAADTTVYVDYDGDPTTGPNTDANGDQYDVALTVATLESVQVYDNNDNDQTGMRLYTLDGVLITAAWGQDPATSQGGTPYLDLGTGVLPFPVPSASKASALVVDVNSNGKIDWGDTVEYTITVNNDGVVVLGGIVAFDALPAGVTYVAGSATLAGSPVPDESAPPAASAYPLDDGGLAMSVIPPTDFSAITFRVTIDNGTTTVINNASINTDAVVLTTDDTINVNIPASVTIADLEFTNAGGTGVASYAENGGIYVTVNDNDQNTDSGSLQSVTVVVVNPDSGDVETITLTETGNDTGVFRNTSALPSSTTGGQLSENGTLYAIAGNTLQATYTDPTYGDGDSDTAVIALPVETKPLYLSAPGQSLDRVDPVATGDGSTETTIELSAVSTDTVRDEFSAISFSGNNGTQNWSNDWQELGESDGTGSGHVRVYNSSTYCASPNCLRIGGDETWITGDGVSREADLSGAATATLTFNYRRRRSGGSVAIEVSGNGGSNWTTLATYNISGTDGSQQAASFDISSYIAANTQIRFIGSGSTGDPSYIYFDNVQIEYQIPGTSSTNITTDRDAWINETDTSKNFGTDVKLYIEQQSNEEKRGLIHFDLAGQSGTTVTSATLYMYLQGGENKGNDLVAYPATRDWEEGIQNGGNDAANWTQAADSTNWTSAGGDYTTPAAGTMTTADKEWRTMTLSTTLVQSWIDSPSGNYGLLLINENGDENKLQFSSSEGTYAPYLYIEYQEATLAAKVSFNQSPSMCHDFEMPAGGTLGATAYINVTGGSLPASPDITATIKHDGAIIETLTNPTVTNIGGCGAPWYNSNWGYRKKITIDSTKVTANLTNFPVLIDLASDAQLAGRARSDGFDILFTDDDGTTKLDHEIEEYVNGTGELSAWVEIPSLPSSADKGIYMYYGYAASSDQQNITGVWDSNFAGVWHLSEEQSGTGTADLYKDSTANNNHGDDYVSATGQDGKIDGGQDFDGTDDYVDVGESYWDGSPAGKTFTFWFQRQGNGNTSAGVEFVLAKGAGSTCGFGFGVNQSDKVFVARTNLTNAASSLTVVDDTWYHVAVVAGASNFSFYFDGSFDSAPSYTYACDNSWELAIGRGANNYFNGVVDEVRISSTARDVDWIKTEYNNQSDPASFYDLGAEEINGAACYRLDWTDVIGSDTTVLAGEQVGLDIASNESGVSFTVKYDSSTYPSRVDLPTTTVILIQVSALAAYDAPYPGGSAVTDAENGATLYIRTTVSDPFGPSDITDVDLVINDPCGGGPINVTLDDSDVVASGTCSKTYEYPWSTGTCQGAYDVIVTANEGTEGISDTAAIRVTLSHTDTGTPGSTAFTDGSGTPVAGYNPNAAICVQVTDIDQNTNPVAAETVSATLTSPQGDSEALTLTETAVDSGVFRTCIASSSSVPGAADDGSLYTLAGDLIDAAYSDPDDAADSSNDSAMINTAAPAMAIGKSLADPADGTADVDDAVRYDIVVANPGTTVLTTYTVTDTFPAACLSYDAASIPPDTIGAGTLTWDESELGTIAAGGSVSLSIWFTAAAACSPAVNSVSAAGQDENTTAVSAGPATASVTITEPDLSLTKTLIDPAAGPAYIGDPVTFRLTLQNTGGSAITTLPLTDTFSAVCYTYQSATVVPDGIGSGTLLWNNLGPLAIGASTSVDVVLTVAGECNPAQNTADVSFAVDENGDGVPAVADSAGLQTIGAKIGDTVWNDRNGDGVRDPDEGGIPGVIVFVDSNDDGNRDPGEPYDTSNAGGGYDITSLAAGTYTVRLEAATVPAGALLTGGSDPVSVGVTIGQDYNGADFGLQGNASIGDFIWDDLDGDGSPDGGEPGLANVTVFLDLDDDGMLDFAEPFVVTDGGGNYDFTNLVPGDYTVDVDDTTLPANYALTTGFASLSVSLADGEDYNDADFGYRLQEGVTGHLFNDVDGDGVQDPGEPDLAGVDVVITDSTSAQQTVTTDAGGDYQAVVPPGSTTLDVDDTSLPPGGTLTTANDPQSVTVNPGVFSAGADVGYQFAVLSITKTSDAGGAVAPGQTLTYTMTVVNNTGATHTGITVGDNQPVGSTYVAASSQVTAPLGGVDNVRDEFAAAAYNLNDGSENWAGDWSETNDDGSAAGGTILIDGATGQLRVRGAVNDSIRRSVDLSGMGVASLSFDLGSSGNLDAGYDNMVIEASSDGASFTPLETFTADPNPNPTLRSYDLTPYISATTTIRFRITDGVESGEYYSIDNVNIIYAVSLANNVRDQFSTAAYNLNDGSATWAGDWSEANDDNNPAGGTILIDGATGQLRVSGASNDSIRRTADLTGAALATLTFDIGSSGTLSSDADNMVIEASDDGSSFTVLEEFIDDPNPDPTARSYDLTPYISATTTIRFRVTTALESADYYSIDDVDISYAPWRSLQTVAGDALPTPADGYELRSGETMTVTFQVTVDDPLPRGLSELTNTAEVTSDQQGTPQSATVVDPLILRAAAGGSVWIDLDDDGTVDIGEPGLGNVTVSLHADDDGTPGPSPGDTVLGSAVTDLNGAYLFTNVPAGDYYVDVTDGDIPTGLTPSAGTSDPSAVFTLAGGGGNLAVDFGYTTADPGTGIVGDLVWSDADGDGVRDAGEPGLGGVTLDLLADGPDGVRGTADDVLTDTATTAADGSYYFSGVAPERYTVSVTDTGGVLSG